jgi:hypothetical protein
MTQEQKVIREYRKGQSSFYDGNKEEDCSYRGGKELSIWLIGFHDAQDGIEKDADEILQTLEKRNLI